MYGDQVAYFRASSPHDRIRQALVDVGWLPREPVDAVVKLGLDYVSGAHFLVDLADRRRMVRVDLTPDGEAWRLRVAGFERGRSPQGVVPYRRLTADGSPRHDPLAARVAYDVALVLHQQLQSVADDLRCRCIRRRRPAIPWRKCSAATRRGRT